MPLFYPTIVRKRITDVTTEDLRALGAKGILLDVDNTLTVHGSQEVSDAVQAWLKDREKDGFLLAVVSNNKEERVRPFAEKIGLSFVAKARKPLPSGFRRAAEAWQLSANDCVVIGDQIFTDIVGANLSGMPSVLLTPIAPEQKEYFIRFKRILERPLIAAYRRKTRR